jgi:hypothetical protein
MKEGITLANGILSSDPAHPTNQAMIEENTGMDGLIHELITELDGRMDNVKVFYPFLEIHRHNKSGNEPKFDLPAMCIAVLSFLLYEGKLKYRGLNLTEIALFITRLLEIINHETIGAAEAKEYAALVLDELQNEGTNFMFRYYSYAAGEPKEKMVKLIEMKLSDEDNTFYYYLTKQGIDFYLKTKEFPEETQITINLLLFRMQIKKGAFIYAYETVKRLNLEVRRKIEKKNWLLDLLMYGGSEGAAAYREYHESTKLQFHEESQLFEEVRNLLRSVYQDYIDKIDKKTITDKEKQAFSLVKRIENELKKALTAHLELLKGAAGLTYEYDQILKLRRKAAFSERFHFEGELEKIVTKVNDPVMLKFIIAPFLRPLTRKRFNPLKLYLPQRLTGSAGRNEAEENAVLAAVQRETIDELVKKRVSANILVYATHLLVKLASVKELTLAAWCESLKTDYGSEALSNPDFIAFIIELNRGKPINTTIKRYPVDKIRDLTPDNLSFMEDVFREIIEKQHLHSLRGIIEVESYPDEDISLDNGVKITKLVFREVDE